MAQQLRADAERNRRRILDAASELFAEKGLSVGLDEIARHAGVGVGTAYRRFATKDELIDALFEDRVAEIAALAEGALEADDPWEGLVGFLESAVELHIANRAVKELIFTQTAGAYERVAEARERIAPIVGELVTRAQASGDLRDDVEVTDVPLLQFLMSGAADLGGPAAADIWRRLLAIVVDGLRASSATPLPRPALTQEEFQRALAG
jgi:AcrR family transcriptional regulator